MPLEFAEIRGRLLLPRTAEPVLLGASMPGAVAAAAYPLIPQAMAGMSGLGTSTRPTAPATARFHQAKRRAAIADMDVAA